MKRLIALLMIITAGFVHAQVAIMTLDIIHADDFGEGQASNDFVNVQIQADANSATGAVTTANVTTNAEDVLRNTKQYQYDDPDIDITPDSAFTFDGDGTITAYVGGYDNLVFPYEIGGVAVTGISFTITSEPFLKTIITPKTLTVIDSGLASDCGQLVSITLQSVSAIGDSFVSTCNALTSISLPFVENAGNSFAEQCSSLVNINLPSLVSAGDSFCSQCGSLENLDLPSIESIGGSFVFFCTSLTNVSFSSDAPTLGSNPYSGVAGVTNYVLDATATGWGNFFGGRPVVRTPLAGTIIRISDYNGTNSISNTADGMLYTANGGNHVFDGHVEGPSADFTGAVTAATLRVTGTASGIDAVLDPEFTTLGQVNTALTAYVPYTGATDSLAMGTNNITANNLTVTNNATVSGILTVEGTNNVIGISTHSNLITLANDLVTIEGDLVVTGAVTSGGNAIVTTTGAGGVMSYSAAEQEQAIGTVLDQYGASGYAITTNVTVLADTWTDIPAAFVINYVSGFSFAGGSTIQYTGTNPDNFVLLGHTSLKAGSANSLIEVGLETNGVYVVGSTSGERKFSTTTDAGSVGYNKSIQLSNGDTIGLIIRSDTGQTITINTWQSSAIRF